MTVKKPLSCSENYACLRAFKSCFSSQKSAALTNLLTLDGIQYFPKDFIDLKSFNSNKAQAMGDDEE